MSFVALSPFPKSIKRKVPTAILQLIFNLWNVDVIFMGPGLEANARNAMTAFYTYNGIYEDEGVGSLPVHNLLSRT